ncbi:M48 family metalloprotease [Streptomyces sp. NPDC006739]|uniref:M48 family metalloprotease n=1 Tax=Streptomyces sp. NPDC006739 TaxID=3364763 RepID=UPI0036B6A593
MGATPRALRALVLLCGFRLLSPLLLAVPALLGVVAVARAHGPVTDAVAGATVLVSVVLAVPVVRGMSMMRTPSGEDPPGIPVTESDEPRLWALVRELADAAGTRAPERIVLTGDVGAVVTEEPRLLGLRPGPRRLHLGVPLMTGLSEAQLRAVLAHEYGHFTGGDTRLSALVARGRARLARIVGRLHATAHGERDDTTGGGHGGPGAGMADRMTAALHLPYAKLCLRASLATARDQEYAADLTAARIAGREATASALREIQLLAAAHDFYLRSYATLGVPVRLLPPRGEFFGGFGRMLTAREPDLARLRTRLPAAPSSPYDPHPPVAERVRRVDALPPDGRAEEPGGAASAVLADPGRTLAALEDAVLSEELLAFRRAGAWQDLLDDSMAKGLAGLDTPLHRALGSYTRQAPTLPALLRLIEDGRLWRLARRLPLPEEAAPARGHAFRESVRPVLRESLQSMVLAEFSACSLLCWEFSWSRPAVVRLPGWTSEGGPDGGPEARLDAAVTAALADTPDTGPLRALLPPAPQYV